MSLRDRLRTAARLFFVFFRIGAFNFGGGYAMIPLIEREVVDKRGLIRGEELADIVAIAESTPGPIAVNAATFVGYHAGGFFGALGATVGVALPSFVVMLLVSLCLRRFMQSRIVSYAFFGIRAGVLALIVRAVLTISASLSSFGCAAPCCCKNRRAKTSLQSVLSIARLVRMFIRLVSRAAYCSAISEKRSIFISPNNYRYFC